MMSGCEGCCALNLGDCRLVVVQSVSACPGGACWSSELLGGWLPGLWQMTYVFRRLPVW